ncbi:uncharacterized protein PGRI_020570 [Penicillium griseofulvum]|uniref:Uncharacterized protein n=1 Tax=Penicillium patulum TaxID=5078 RepID=A0A135LGS5_PENPA|nr:uncharacterized protein PGRI_020570 [Penicillium griseofulvum]KXG48187.1 hypothetical protein PGRI_020570 [Penicillium griseofulvum]
MASASSYMSLQGGYARRQDKSPSMFISSTVPIVHENTIILAVTQPTLSTAGPQEDGWLISDFYAFNYLLKGLGMKQTWLTAVEPSKLVQKYGSYLHGNPYESRICLSQELIDNNEFSPVTVVNPAIMIDQFLIEAKEASEVAKRHSAPLLLLVFCHTLPGFDFLLGNETKHKGLTATGLKGVLEPGVHVSLVATACHSGGWVTIPDFNHTTMAAAYVTCENVGKANARADLESIARTCGSAFASTIVESLSSAASPLLCASERSEPSSSLKTMPSIQPEGLDQCQALAYNALCDSISRTCEQRVTRLWNAQGFSSNVQDDHWDSSWTGRTGVPLSYFERRWEALTPYTYTGPALIRDLGNTQPNSSGFLGAGPTSSGSASEIVEQMTDNITHGRIKAMGRHFRQTCPGDWDRGRMVGFGGTLRAYIERDEYKERAPMFAATIRFRWEMALLTDYVVSYFNLPKPDNQICIMWNGFAWMVRMDKADPTWHEREEKITRALGECFHLVPRDDQGPLFFRPNWYLTASLVEANKPHEETMAIISAIIQFMETLNYFHKQRACEDECVRRCARDWFKSIGRRALQSLSP